MTRSWLRVHFSANAKGSSLMQPGTTSPHSRGISMASEKWSFSYRPRHTTSLHFFIQVLRSQPIGIISVYYFQKCRTKCLSKATTLLFFIQLKCDDSPSLRFTGSTTAEELTKRSIPICYLVLRLLIHNAPVWAEKRVFLYELLLSNTFVSTATHLGFGEFN